MWREVEDIKIKILEVKIEYVRLKKKLNEPNTRLGNAKGRNAYIYKGKHI